MSTEERTVPEGLAGERLDKALVQLFVGASRAKAKKAIEAGGVWVNGRRMAKGGVVKSGDVLACDPSLLMAADEPPVPEPNATLTVRFETSDLLVVDKPAKMPTAPLRVGETGTLAGALLGHYPELEGIGYGMREPGLVHRLDTDTSGLVVVAKNARAFEELRTALKDERIEKEYLLLCAAEGLPDEGEIDIPLANHPKDEKRVLACLHPRDVMRLSPRAALTRYRVEQVAGEFALVRAFAHRALRHQIRAHFAAIDHPLVGDALYGGPEAPGLGRHALHAARVAFKGKTVGTTFDVAAELPPDLAELLR